MHPRVIEFLAACKQDPLRYVLGVFPWETDTSIQKVPLPAKYRGRFPDCHWGPDEWQCDFLDQLGRDIKERGFDGHKPVSPIRYSVVSGHGIGKALRDDEEVPTPSGKKRVDEIKVGDTLFGEKGEPVKVTGIRTYQTAPLYRVTFSDRSSVVVSSGHLWKVKGRNSRRTNGGWEQLTTQDILNRGVLRANGVSKAKQWQIPRNGPVQFQDSPLPVDPYTYGVWLGDGTKANGQVTNTDPEVWSNIPYPLSGPLTAKYRRTVYGLSALLKKAGMFGCDTYTAKVDPRYLYHADRLAVLQGLLDTDGWVEMCGAAAFASASEQLTRDVVELARSLGLVAREPVFKKNNKRGSWGTLITWDGKTQLFRITRKQERLVHAEERYQTRWISKIEQEPPAACRCFEVEGGLFQTGQYHVTHNSTLSAWLVKFILDTRPYSVGTVTANTAPQLRTKTWAEVGKWHNISATKEMFKYTLSSNQMSLVHVDPELAARWKCFAHTCDPGNSESFAGQHSDATSFYIYDEASKIDDLLFDVREGGLKGGEPMVFDFGNGTRNTGRFKENCVGKYRHRHRVWSIDSRDAYRTNKDEIQEEVDLYGVDSDYVRVRIRGLFPKQASSQFIDSGKVEEAQSRLTPAPLHVTPLYIGVDVALQGADSTVIYPRLGSDARSYPPRQFRGLDPEQIANEVKQYVMEFKTVGYHPAGIFIDGGGGYGSGVFTHLRQMGIFATLVYPGRNALRPKDYGNRITEMWAEMRDAINTDLCLPDTSSRVGKELSEELTDREASPTLSGQIRLVSKEKLAKSPDIADALALTFAKTTLTGGGQAGPQVIKFYEED